MCSTRRVKIVSFNVDVLKNIFNWWLSPPDFIALPICEGLPEDAIVLSVFNNWQLGTIEFMVMHPSFSIVPVGECPPMLPKTLTSFRHINFQEWRDNITGPMSSP